jgi:hypothetical protein
MTRQGKEEVSRNVLGAPAGRKHMREARVDRALKARVDAQKRGAGKAKSFRRTVGRHR